MSGNYKKNTTRKTKKLRKNTSSAAHPPGQLSFRASQRMPQEKFTSKMTEDLDSCSSRAVNTTKGEGIFM